MSSANAAEFHSDQKPAGRFSAGFDRFGGWLRAKWHGFITRPGQTLPQYHQPPIPARHFAIKTIGIILIGLLGMVYGFLISIFPVFLYLYLAVPIGLMAIAAIWALPENDNVPIGTVYWLFAASCITICVWPNYLAFSFPGLPWITFARLFAIPMTAIFLLSLSMSPKLRGELTTVMRSNKWAWIGVTVFVALQFLTLPGSEGVFGAFNRIIVYQFHWTAMFFVAALYFTKEGRITRASVLILATSLFLMLVSVLEFRMNQVPWANYIPSFLAVPDETVAEILRGGQRSATGAYRIQSIFSTSLNYAEFLALVTPFALHYIATSRNRLLQLGIIATIPYLFWVIWKTDSRLGMVGFFMSILLYVLLFSVKQWMKFRQSLIAPAIVMAYPAIFAAFLALSIVWRRLEVMVWGGGPQQASNDARKLQWELAYDKFLSWPLGHGTGRAPSLAGTPQADGDITLDSYFITIGLDYGVLGFVAYFGAFGWIAWRACRLAMDTDDKELQLLLPLGIMLWVSIFSKSVLNQTDNHGLTFMALGAAAALCHRATMQKTTPYKAISA